MSHTSTPWFAGQLAGDDEQFVTIGEFEADNHYESTICAVYADNHDAEANAAFIVAAANSYGLLLPALRLAREWVSCVEGPLSDTTAFKRDLATIDEALAAANSGSTP